MNENKKKQIERVKFFMKDKNLNQTELANSIRLTHSAISVLISGKTKLTSSFALSLQAVYNLNPDWILHGTEPMYLPHENKFSDPRQKAINEAYESISEEGKQILHDTAIKQREEHERRLKRQAEYESQHRKDVTEMFSNRIIPKEVVELPIVGYVQAGVPTWTEELHEGNLSWDRSRISAPENAFWLRIQGTSMIDCGMYPNDCILCDSGIIPRKGDAVVAKVGNEMTVKEYRRIVRDGKPYIELRPCNPDFPTLSYPEEEVQIVATVIANDWRLKRGEEKTWRR